MSTKTLHLLFCGLFLLAVTACDNRNIHQVVKEIAEAPVDTAGMEENMLQANVFSEIEIDCFADVTFHQHNSFFIKIKARPEVLPHVSVKNTDCVLRLSTDRRYRMPEKAVIAIDISAPSLNKAMLNGIKCLRLGNIKQSSPLHLDINGVGAITANTVIVPEISCNLVGAGSIDLKGIDTQRLTAELTGSGNIYLQGRCDKQIFKQTGTGTISFDKQ